MRERDIPAYLKANPPRCLSGFRPLWKTSWGRNPSDSQEAVWQLRCRCGEKTGVVLGYPLGDLKAGYEGSGFFVSPLAFRCGGCGSVTEVIDTGEHGEGSENAARSGHDLGCCAYRGEGDRTAVTCPTCETQQAEAFTRFLYHEETVDEFLEEQEIRLEDYFNWFVLDCVCSACRGRWEVANIDTK